MGKSDEFFDRHPQKDYSKIPGMRAGTRGHRRRTPKKDLEAGVLRECMVWLNRHGYYCERRNTGAFRTTTSFVRFGNPGAADILAVIDGRHIEIECKRRDGKGRQSPSQQDFEQLMKDYRIPYIVVRSAEKLAEAVGELRLHWCR